MNGNNNGSSSTEDDRRERKKNKVKALLQDKDEQISALEEQIEHLTQQLARAGTTSSSSSRKIRNRLAPHAVHVQETTSRSSSKRKFLTHSRERMGRKASINTRRVLDQLETTQNSATFPSSLEHQLLAQKMVDMFKDPASHLDYLNSQEFGRDLFSLFHHIQILFHHEPRVVFLQSPCYVFGDIHGNLEDLHFFSDNIWRLGMALTAGNFLFLGDYVDRGMSCLEVVGYLFAMKLLLPHKVFLLRGNHETRDVSGWVEHYGERSFLHQCQARFGERVGYRLWESANQCFDRMPLAAVIDQDVFCVHGGIPRPILTALSGSNNGTTSRIQDILNVPKVAGINPPYEHEGDEYQQVASDCIWSDPASEEQEMSSVDPVTGYGESLRGGGAICFGNKAVTDFLQQQGYSYVMRAHEAHAEGVAVCKEARVFTVFSTSKDHNQGSQAMAGCILVDFEKLQVINRSPAYKNQYVHRRDSVSLQSVSESEIEKRMKLGLVTNSPRSEDEEGDEEEEEQWEELEDNEVIEEEQPAEEYVFATNRRSSIDLNSTSENVHDSIGSLDSTDYTLPRSGGTSLIVDFDPAKRQLSSRKPRVSAIHEEMDESMDTQDDEEVETVDGEESSAEWGNEPGR